MSNLSLVADLIFKGCIVAAVYQNMKKLWEMQDSYVYLREVFMEKVEILRKDVTELEGDMENLKKRRKD